MKRRPFTILSAISLLLCLAVCVMWVRSYRVGEEWHFIPSGPTEVDSSLGGGGHTTVWQRYWCIASGHGRIQVVRRHMHVVSGNFHFGQTVFDKPEQAMRLGSPMDPTKSGHLAGFRFVSTPRQIINRGNGVSHQWGVLVIGVPYWCLALIAAVLPAIWLVRQLRRNRRINEHRCLVCGYDLRATPTRCPECGEPPAPAGVQSSP